MFNAGMKLRFYPLFFFLLLTLLVFYACEKKASEEARPASITSEAAKSRDINLRETRLASIPEEYDRWGNITFSADGRQVFYKARNKSAEFIVAASGSGKTIGSVYESVSFLVPSPDGRRFAYGGGKGGKKHLVVDNQEVSGLFHEEVAPGAFSPDGRLVASEAGGFKEKKWFVVVSDDEKELYRSQAFPDTFRPPVFSPDGRLLVFELGDHKMKVENKKRTVFFLDVSARKIIRERVCTDCEAGGFSFSSDSSRVIYDVQKEGKTFLVLNDFELHKGKLVELPYTLTGKPLLSREGKYIITIAIKQGKYNLILSTWESPVRGKESGQYEAVISPVFGPDAKTAVYLAMKDGKWRAVIGNKEGPTYNKIGNAPLVFSQDGGKIAYSAMKDSANAGPRDRGMKNGKWVMVVSGVGNPAAVKEGPGYDMVVTPVFSPDGRRIAYRGRKGPMEQARRFIVIADAETGKVIKEGPIGDEIWPPVWSSDGKAVGYGSRQGRELWWRVEAVE